MEIRGRDYPDRFGDPLADDGYSQLARLCRSYADSLLPQHRYRLVLLPQAASRLRILSRRRSTCSSVNSSKTRTHPLFRVVSFSGSHHSIAAIDAHAHSSERSIAIRSRGIVTDAVDG